MLRSVSLDAATPECVLLLHVHDVLGLVKQNYLERVLEPTLRDKYKISFEVVSKDGDELTFLKRRQKAFSHFS